MKIGILTFTLNSNYGAGLQAFALSEFLKSEGHEVVILNIRRQRIDKWIDVKFNWKRKIYNFAKNLVKHCLNSWQKDSFNLVELKLREQLAFMDFFRSTLVIQENITQTKKSRKIYLLQTYM